MHLCAILCFLLACPAQEPPAKISSSQTAGASTAPGSAEELRKFLVEMAAALQSGGKTKVEQMAETLILKNPEAFFQRAFGEEEGKRITAAYERSKGRAASSFLSDLEFAIEGGRSEFVVARLENPPALSPGRRVRLQDALLSALKEPVTFYQVGTIRPGDGEDKNSRTLDFFAHIDGDFRHFSRMTLSALSTAPPFRIRVGGLVQQAKLINQPKPFYPEEAKAKGIEGTVRLQVIVGRDGVIFDISVLSGPAELVEGTIHTIRQWRYQPTMLNGQPVEVVTTIDVVYTLGRR